MIQPEALHQLIYDHICVRYGCQLAFTVRSLLNLKERSLPEAAGPGHEPSALELLVTHGFLTGAVSHIQCLAQQANTLFTTVCTTEASAEAYTATEVTAHTLPRVVSETTIEYMGRPAIDMVTRGKTQLVETCIDGRSRRAADTTDDPLRPSDNATSIGRGIPITTDTDLNTIEISGTKIVPTVNATTLVLQQDSVSTTAPAEEEFYPVPATAMTCEFKPLNEVYNKYHDFVTTENVLQSGKIGPTPFSHLYDRKLRVDINKTVYTMYPACNEYWAKQKHRHSGSDPFGNESTDEYSQADDPGRIVYTYDYDNDNVLNTTFEVELHSFAQAMQEIGPDFMLKDGLVLGEKPAVALGEQYATVTPTSPQLYESAGINEVEFTGDDEGAMDDSAEQILEYTPVGDNMDPDLIEQQLVKDTDEPVPTEANANADGNTKEKLPEAAFKRHIDKKIEDTERSVTPYVVRKQSMVEHKNKGKQYIITGDTMRADVLHQIYKGETRNSQLLDLVGFYNIPLYYGLYSEFKGLHELRFRKGAVLAGRYEIYQTIFEDSAFSVTLKARDLKEGKDVCLKVVNNEKETLDQCLNEIRLLTYINKHDPTGKHFVRMIDYFYYGHRLIIIFELLTSNLFSYYSARETSLSRTTLNPLATIFTMPRLQHITRQILESLDFLHRLNILHLDLKHENLLLVNEDDDSFDIKLVDIGSSAFLYDECSTYVQSRSYRCPEVILGLPYDGRADVWSLGPILTELITGKVMFPIPQKADEDNKPYASMLAKLIGIIGPIPRDMILAGRESHKFFTKDLFLFETRDAILGNRDKTEGLKYAEIKDEDYVYVLPKKTTIKAMLGWDSHPEYCDDLFLDFIETIMRIDPRKRPTAAEALEHPWLKHVY